MEDSNPPLLPDRLAPAQLCRICDPTSLGFNTTDDLPDLENVIGQPRAIRSLELGSEVAGPGYNTFVMGISGSGRTTLTREYLERKAAKEPVPDEWCYVNNFENPRHPKALCLPPGRGAEFARDIQELIRSCEIDAARTFESEGYTQERDRLVDEMKKNQEAEFIRLQQHVEKYNFVLVRNPFGFILIPAVQGKPLKPEEIEMLSEEQKTKLAQLQTRLQEEVEKSLARLKEIESAASNQLKELNERTILFGLEPLIEDLTSKYSGLDGVLNHLQAIKTDIVDNASQFFAKQPENPVERAVQAGGQGFTRRYEVNLLVDRSEQHGAPVMVENYPSYTNLLGRIEHEVVMGISHTDFTMIQPGALHTANGGYLVLPARDLMNNPYAWDGLKRALRDSELRIVELANQLGLISTVTLEPEPIPLNIKVILVGTPLLYYLLRQYDEDFPKLFKVRAEFGTLMDRVPETEKEYGLFVKSVLVDNRLPPFDASAVARIIEYSSRLAEDQYKLSTRFGKIADLVRESAYWAKKENPEGLEVVTGEAVRRAIQEGIYRSSLLEERIRDEIRVDALMIDVSGEAVGQINALTVTFMGDYSFGHPSRVTATAYPGRGGMINIERLADLSGPIHTKGVLILNGFMHNRFGRKYPLSVSASVTFEQSYDSVEGDSASTAELYAMLSAIANVPLRQDRAITGALNQHGMMQPIGGVNEKIEGFYAVCKLKGLTGEQGVIIPTRNISDLMLNEEVVHAVEDGQFHIWAIDTVDEGIALMIGMEPGERQEDGSYPENTLYRLVQERLEEFAKADERRHTDEHEKEDEEESEIEADEAVHGEPVDESLPEPDQLPPGEPVDEMPQDNPFE